MKALSRFWRTLPLSSKLTGLASLLVLAVVASLMALTVQRERATFRQELEGQAQLLLETLPLMMRDELYRLEVDELMDVASVIGGHENVTLFIVYDREGKALVDASQPDPVFAQTPDPWGAELVAAGPDAATLIWQPHQLMAGRAVALGNQGIGAVAIGLSTEPLDEKLALLTRQSVALALGTLLLGGGGAFVIARQITTPLAALAAGAARMSSGDLAARVELRSEDEIGRLGDAFNRMAVAIQRRETELRELAASLERTVATRTAELRQQNETLVETNAALTVARQQAEEANRAKSAVLSMVSHELRTPLTSILGFAKIIKRRLALVVVDDGAEEVAKRMEQSVEQMRENIDIIVSEGERLTSLINDVLDLAKIESGRSEWQMQPLAVAEIVQSSVAATASLFETKPLALHVDVPDDLPPVPGDRDRLVQVMVNLISNAVKFTERGSVTCRARREGEGVVISVVDTGVGIRAEDYGRVFERFVQVGERPAGAPQGTGLGLPICKEIVERHGGRIWVESAPGAGSTFFFTLPV